MDPIIQVENIVRTFGSTRAIDGISFSVDEGEVFGVLGRMVPARSRSCGCSMVCWLPRPEKHTFSGKDVTFDGSYIRERTVC